MTCDREALLTLALDDPALLDHLERCDVCRAEHQRLVDALPAFHRGLQRDPAFPLPDPRPRRSLMPKILVAAAAIAAVTLVTTNPAPVEPQVQQASAGFELAQSLESVGWKDRTGKQWLELAKQLLPHAEKVVANPPVDAKGLQVLVQTGRAAENANEVFPPFVVTSGRKAYNRFYMEAARAVKQDPALLETIHDEDARATVYHLVRTLEE